eukprot:CAMPEP_0195523454 /NCGR_PEP_ID=MMETSP0794_2-20130614/22672_1 /TAXON_ID=515487 /ORGANISM="Stephanopyxis turris, Strain CCMP 815" /LENGTH=235 /DNA_ID=CAMNT_0040653463 /DNA_START=82 /DNA_END=789 /DNA_ORIENTATION=+
MNSGSAAKLLTTARSVRRHNPKSVSRLTNPKTSSSQACFLHIQPTHRQNNEEKDENARYSPRTMIDMHHQRSNSTYQLSQTRLYHATHHVDNTALVLGLGSIALAAKAGQYGVQAYKEWEKNQPEEPIIEEQGTEEAAEQAQEAAKSSKKEGKRTNFFDQFGFGVGTKYYEGGFEDTMTRKEAALILGVRESASAKRIKTAHRNILILNHPDTGGSNYMASKINEAKELLLKGKE